MFLSQLGKMLFGSRKTRAAAANRSNYRAVEVFAGKDGCCSAAQDILGRRFLSDEVPMLPLPQCDAQSCGCTYRLYNDRRRSSLGRGEDCGVEAACSDELVMAMRRGEDRAA